MANEIPGLMHTYVAGADLSTHQYKAVIASTTAAKQCLLAGAAATGILGVLQNKPASGRPGTVMLNGRTKAVYGATVAAGDPLATDASGRFIPAAANPRVAIALEAGAVNEIHSIQLLS
jgi:hypothetical protein